MRTTLVLNGLSKAVGYHLLPPEIRVRVLINNKRFLRDQWRSHWIVFLIISMPWKILLNFMMGSNFFSSTVIVLALFNCWYEWQNQQCPSITSCNANLQYSELSIILGQNYNTLWAVCVMDILWIFWVKACAAMFLIVYISLSSSKYRDV